MCGGQVAAAREHSPVLAAGTGQPQRQQGPADRAQGRRGHPACRAPGARPDAVSTFSLCHSVDNGDIAFFVTPVDL